MIQILPAISEKAISLLSQNQYSFWVNKNASKPAIKSAIEDQFKVKVKAINTHHRFGLGGKKMAIATLSAGNKIKEFGPQEQPKDKK